jgi:hypothetical protein
MATLTINTSGAEDARLATAFGVYLGLAGTANAAQIKAATVAWITSIVANAEYQTQAKAISISPIAPT